MLTKRKLKNKVRVTFTLPAREGEESICLVGDFNNWEECVTSMARNKDGDWQVKLDLEPNREYQYRYLVNERTWRNDPAADDYVRNPFGSDNSLVSTVVTRLPKRSGSKKSRG
ncbi:MAG TPA: isoamylase early set domain-containing protein [Anaerolineae bacterium]|nr:isoamylase early set domain-containing protein [Anaerolineae bacterium]